MSLLHRFLATGAPAEPLYSDSVFSAYTYTGNGSTQTINNGIDLAGKGGLVWVKSRDSTYWHHLADTARGVNNTIFTNDTAAQVFATNRFTSFNSNGFSLGNSGGVNSAEKYASWTFRKQPKFFDVVTYTGNATNRTISHSLGSVPGMIIVKRTDAAADWQVYHTSLANTEYMVLNTTAAKATGATRWNSTTPTSSIFSLGTDTTVNASGGTYVAYLFAHDTSATGLIQCGSFTTDGSGNATVNLGWEPQYVLFRQSNSVWDWTITDSSRGGKSLATVGSSYNPGLFANSSSAENIAYAGPSATGFRVENTGVSFAPFIYLAIRRPNKPPTLGTQVYNAIARTGTGAAATVTGVGFAPDIYWSGARNVSSIGAVAFWDRLRGVTNRIQTYQTLAETTATDEVTSLDMDGFSTGTSATNGFTNRSGGTYINWFFKRAPGVFDEVCYTGTGGNNTQSHSLEVAPELWIVKGRSGATAWRVGSTALAATEFLVLNDTVAKATDATSWNSTYPTSSVFSLGAQTAVNQNANSFVAYLFATKAGISKVGSYTGNGSSQTINAGFTTGARWVMIKRTDSTGDWYVWDSTRGIVAGNDPHLSLNTTAAEVTTDDSVDTDTSGFIVNQLAATNINVTSATYIYLSFA